MKIMATFTGALTAKLERDIGGVWFGAVIGLPPSGG